MQELHYLKITFVIGIIIVAYAIYSEVTEWQRVLNEQQQIDLLYLK